MVLGIGAYDIPGAPAFVASTSASCLVTTAVQADVSDFDGGVETPVVTVTSLFSVTRGETIRFGAWYNPSPSFLETVRVRQGYTCS